MFDQEFFRALEHLEKLCVHLIENSKTLKLDPRLTEEEESLKKPQKTPDDEENVEVYKVNGCVHTMISRLSTEFIKILQDSDCHSTDYIDKSELTNKF